MSLKDSLDLQHEPAEKSPVDTIDDLRLASLELGPIGFDERKTARLLRKLDWNLVPFVTVLFLLCFLDRANIGNARLTGLERDLGMSGLDYNIALAVFFPFYIIAEVPSNIMLKRMGPSRWLCIIMFVCGICMMCMGFVKNFTGLLFVRMALGLTEGGAYPGIAYYITIWYKRSETALRMALFFSGVTIAGAFGGLLAAAIADMDGVANRPGWSWIFILEGLITIIVAIIGKWAIIDNPDGARFLTEEEKIEVKERLRRDSSDLADEFAMKYVFDALKDWKIWVNSFILIGLDVSLYSIAFFTPTIIKNMGFSNEKSQLMSVPPYVFGCILTIIAGYAADKSHKRGLFVIGLNLLAIAGMVMLISTDLPTVQYIGTFLIISGVYAGFSIIIAWNSSNIGGSTKRAVGIAMQVGFANFAGIISAFSFRTTDAPRYFAGYGLLIGTLSMSAILSLIMRTYFMAENARRDAEMKSLGLTLELYTDEMKRLERDKGDYASFFRFTT